MNKEEILAKLKDEETITISKLQREFNLGYVEASKLYNELKDEHNLSKPQYRGINLIFLDIDGVLNSRTTKEKCGPYRGIEESKVLLLRSLVEKTYARIVLISSWKEWWFKKKQYKSKQDDLANYLDDCLYKAKLEVWNKINDDFALGRGDAINQFIDYLKRKNIMINNYVIFDDEMFDYKETNQTKHLIQTSFENGGLSKKHINKAIEMLNGQKVDKIKARRNIMPDIEFDVVDPREQDFATCLGNIFEEKQFGSFVKFAHKRGIHSVGELVDNADKLVYEYSHDHRLLEHRRLTLEEILNEFKELASD